MAKTNQGLEIDVKLNNDQIRQTIQEKADKAQIRLDARVLADSNSFCPLDTSALQKSAILSTKIGSGLITWSTPYARKQYYEHERGGHFDRNPRACAKWFEAAKARYLKDWLRIINND